MNKNIIKEKIKRSRSQFIGATGESLVQFIIDKNESWISRKMPNDYGIDFELELATPQILGQYIKAQVKSSKHLFFGDNIIKGRVSKKLLNYSCECILPVILIFVDLSKNVAYYYWLQEWIEKHYPNKEFNQIKSSTVKIEIPIRYTLEKGLEKDLIMIASQKTKIQLLFYLRETIKLSILHNHIESIRNLTKIITDISEEYRFFTLDTVIDEIIKLDPGLWRSNEGNNLSNILMEICMDFGHNVNITHLKKILINDNGISRTGISALSKLYTYHFNHIKSLKLPKLFGEMKIESLSYYCKLREKYPKLDDMSLTNENIDTKIDGWDIDKTGRLFDKFINRGCSALFDYMFKTD